VARDRSDERPGPAPKIWSAFLLGAASHFAAGNPCEPIPADALPRLRIPGLRKPCIPSSGRAAGGDRFKILVIFAISARRRRFADPMDTVVYARRAGLGFAAYENLAYLVQHAEMWRALAAVYASVLTVPFHGRAGIIAGAYLAIARSGTALGAHGCTAKPGRASRAGAGPARAARIARSPSIFPC